MARAFQTPATLSLPPPLPASANGSGGGGTLPTNGVAAGVAAEAFKKPGGGAPASRGGWGGPGVTNPNGCCRAPPRPSAVLLADFQRTRGVAWVGD